MCKFCVQHSIYKKRDLPFQLSRAITERGKTWTPGNTIYYRFLGGTDYQKNRIRKAFQIWMAIKANIYVQEVKEGEYTDVRIAFVQGEGSYSVVGTDNYSYSQYNQTTSTLNIGWDDGRVLATELHEIGHLFGYLHEHQSPFDNPFIWLPEVIYTDLAEQGWDKGDVDWNVIDRHLADTHNGTSYDDASIMRYSFPARWNQQGIQTSWNTELSPMDKAYFLELYGSAEPQSAQTFSIDLFKKMFKHKADIRFREEVLVIFANALGVDATIKDTKRKTIDRVHDHLFPKD